MSNFGDLVIYSIIAVVLWWLAWDFFTYHKFDNQLRNRFEQAQLKDVVSIELDEEYPGWETMNLVDSTFVITDPQSIKAIFTFLKSGKKLSGSDNRNREWYAIMKVKYRNNKLSEFKVEHIENGPTYFYLMRDLNEFEGKYGTNVEYINDVELEKYIHNDLNLVLRELTNYKGSKSYLD